MFDKLFDKLFDMAFNNKIKFDLIEKIKPVEGVFDLKLINQKTNKIDYEHKDNNLIVDDAFLIMANLLSDADPNKKIDTIALGDAGIVNNEFVFPYPNDKTLRNELFRKTTRESVQVDLLKKRITFRFLIETIEANGIGAQLYNEAGLFSTDGTMFARKVFPEFVKTQDQIIIIDWSMVWV